MRQRVTFITRPTEPVDPATLTITGGTITGPAINAVREDRLTFAVDELPGGLQSVLRQVHELHIRWSSPSPSATLSPLLSRLPPGFHVFYTPLDASAAEAETLCLALKSLFGSIDCHTPKDSFTALEQGRFSHATASQYFQQMDSLGHFAAHVKRVLCQPEDDACLAELGRIDDIASLDISYDTISHALKLTAQSPYQQQSLHIKAQPGTRTEVGILAEDKPPNLEPHEIGMSGLLAVLGQDSEAKPTLFSFPSRHREAEGDFSVKFLEPTGLHPTLQLKIRSPRPLDDSSCAPLAYFTLPRYVFPDKYQLSDDLFLASKNLTALRYVSQPVDLEAPDYVMHKWGSAMLLELSPQSDSHDGWTAEIPLHLRYLSPAEGGYRNRTVPYPAVFWACHAEEGTKFPTNPFERVNLGYDGLFGPRTSFCHVSPRSDPAVEKLQNTITIPVLDSSRAGLVNAGTAAAVLLGFAWVLWKLCASYTQQQKSEPTVKSKLAEKKRK